ncbi:hypothetical protein BDN67DRAFT_870618, partial [Paxillus ammoniavirescens]
LKIAAAISVMMSDPVAIHHYCFTLLASYIANTPEAQMLSTICDKTLSFTMAMYTQFGNNFQHPPHTTNQTLCQLARLTTNPSTLKVYFKQSTKYCLNGVNKLFWCDWPLADPSVFLSPEPLHHLYKQFWDHDVRWCVHILGSKEINF